MTILKPDWATLTDTVQGGIIRCPMVHDGKKGTGHAYCSRVVYDQLYWRLPKDWPRLERNTFNRYASDYACIFGSAPQIVAIERNSF